MTAVGSVDTRLVVLRGDSGSGKTTTATALRPLLRGKTAVIHQDHFRRTLLAGGEKASRSADAAALIDTVARQSLDLGYDVILDGILNLRDYAGRLDSCGGTIEASLASTSSTSGSRRPSDATRHENCATPSVQSRCARGTTAGSRSSSSRKAVSGRRRRSLRSSPASSRTCGRAARPQSPILGGRRIDSRIRRCHRLAAASCTSQTSRCTICLCPRSASPTRATTLDGHRPLPGGGRVHRATRQRAAVVVKPGAVRADDSRHSKMPKTWPRSTRRWPNRRPGHPLGSGEGRPGLDVSYRIELRPAAVRALKKVDHQDRNRIRGAIALLARTPPAGSEGAAGTRRTPRPRRELPHHLHDRRRRAHRRGRDAGSSAGRLRALTTLPGTSPNVSAHFGRPWTAPRRSPFMGA